MTSPTRVDDGGPAFPSDSGYWERGTFVRTGFKEGMSLRDWLAGQALFGAQARYENNRVPEYELHALFGGRGGLKREEIISALAYAQADALLRARKEPRS